MTDRALSSATVGGARDKAVPSAQADAVGGGIVALLGLDAGKVILLRLVGLPAMFVAMLAGPLATCIGMPKVASVGFLLAAVEAALSQSLAGITIGSLVFVTGAALAVPAMVTQFGALAAPNRAGGMALNGFVLFVGASIGPLIAARVPGFVALLVGLAVALLLAAVCVASSTSIASSGRTS